MSSVDSSGEQVSDDGSQLSRGSLHSYPVSDADSAIDIPESSFSGQPSPQLQSFIESYDRSEAFLCGRRKPRAVIRSLELSMYRNLYEAGALDDGEIRGHNQAHKKIEDDVAELLETLHFCKKYKDINEIASGSARERFIEVYPARKPLPAGENATWDIRSGEERTQPRRPNIVRLRRSASENHQQGSVSPSSVPLNVIQIRNPQKSSNIVNSLEPCEQLPQLREESSNFHGLGQQIDSQSDALSSMSSTNANVVDNSISHILDKSPQNLHSSGDCTRQISNFYPSPFVAPTAITNDPSRVSFQQPIQRLITEPSYVVSNNASFCSANDSTPETSITSSSGSDDAVTSSIDSVSSTLPSQSNSSRRNSESFASRDHSLFSTESEVANIAPHVDIDTSSLPDEDSEWLRAFIHDHMLEPADKRLS